MSIFVARPRSFAAAPFLAFFLALAAGACGGGSGHSASLQVARTDSAGIEIVTNGTAADAVPVYATLDSAPGLKLGSVDGAKEEQFGSIYGLAPLSDGSIAVLDGQAKEVRVFGADGSYLRAVGGAGEGPGELSMPNSVADLPGDTLAVYDIAAGRITLFAPDGELARTVTLLSGGYGRPWRVSFFPDGSLVGQMSYSGSGGFKGSEKLTFALDSAALVAYDADGTFKDTVEILPSREAVRSVRRSGQMVTTMMITLSISHANEFAAGPDGVWSGFNEHFVLRLLDPTDGHVKRILRAPELQRPLTDAEFKEMRDRELADAKTPEERSQTQQTFDLTPRPALRPAYDGLVLDDRGRLWLREWAGANTGPDRWWVFGRDGALLGSVAMPHGLRLMAVRDGRAWGVARDDLGVQYVVRYGVHVTEE